MNGRSNYSALTESQPPWACGLWTACAIRSGWTTDNRPPTTVVYGLWSMVCGLRGKPIPHRRQEGDLHRAE